MHRVVCPFAPQLSLVLINRPQRDGTLSWHWYTAATGGIQTHDLVVASPAPYHTVTTYHGCVCVCLQVIATQAYVLCNSNYSVRSLTRSVGVKWIQTHLHVSRKSSICLILTCLSAHNDLLGRYYAQYSSRLCSTDV